MKKKLMFGTGNYRGLSGRLECDSQCLKPSDTGEGTVFRDKALETPFIPSPVYIHPNIQRFYNKWGTDYLRNIRRLK